MRKGKRDGTGPRPDCNRKDGSGSGVIRRGPRKNGTGRGRGRNRK
ncbi:MAG: hypothetical protein ACOCP4_07215 [Candidatus Woesearchaeota archaeon]